MNANILGIWLPIKLAQLHARNPVSWPDPATLKVCDVTLHGPDGTPLLVCAPDARRAIQEILTATNPEGTG